VSQAAAALGRSDKSIRRLIARGDLRAIKQRTRTGQEWRIPVEDVAALGGQVTDTDGQVTDTDGQVTDTDGHQVTDRDGQEMTVSLAQVETRLARIEGVLAGQWMSELSAEVAAMSALLRTLGETHESLRQELAASREESRKQAEEHQQELTTIQEAAQRREEATQRREEALLSRLEALQEAWSRPWWKRLWPWDKGSTHD
jgi:excisionase family DNA binding protein